MKNTMKLGLLLIVLLILVGCGNSTGESNVIIATSPTEAVPATTEEVPTVLDSFMTLERLEAATSWEEIKNLSWDPITEEDRCIASAISGLSSLGKAYRDSPGFAKTFRVDEPGFDLDRLEEKLLLLLKLFNSYDKNCWEVKFGYTRHLVPNETAMFEFRIEEFDLKYTPEYIGDLVVACSEIEASKSPEHFGTGSKTTFPAGTTFVVTGVTYLTEIGDVDQMFESISVPCHEMDDLGVALPIINGTYRMLELCPVGSTQPIYVLPTEVLPANIASAN